MKRSLFVCFLVLTSFCVYAQQSIGIKGRCLDEKGLPIAYVNVSVIDSLSKNPIIEIITTNNEGYFRCNKAQNGHTLRFSMMGYQTEYRQVSSFEDKANLSIILKESPEELAEVVITSEKLKTYGIKDEIYLSKKDREKGINALDVITNLHQFRLNIGNGRLQTQIGKSVLIIIDGKRASERELMMLQPKNISKLVFYTNPPSKYAHEAIESVLEVKTKKEKDANYFLYIDTKNSVTTGYGTNLLSFSYTDSLNQISAAYFIDYRSLNGNLTHNNYQYHHVQNNYIGQSGTYKGQYHIGQISYQRSIENNTFFSKLSYRGNPGKESATQLFLTNNVEKTKSHGISKREIDSKYYGLDFEIYFMKEFTSTKSIGVNMVSTFYNSSSNSILSRTVDSDPAMDYSFVNRIKNRSYSVIGEILFSNSLLGGQWNIGGFSMYKKLSQSYNNEVNSEPYYWKHYLYTDFSKNIEKLGYTIGIGIDNHYFKTTDNSKYSHWLLRPLISLSYKIKNNSSIRFTSSVSPQIPEIGYLTNSIANIDEFFYTQGNTNLKPSYTYKNSLEIQYRINDNIYASPSFFYNYHVKSQIPILVKRDENILKTYVNTDEANEFGYSISANCNVFQNFTLQPYYQYSYIRYQTPNSSIKHHCHNAGVSVQFTAGKIQALWNAYLPFTSVDGDFRIRQGLNMSANLLWKSDKFSVGTEWIHNPKPTVMCGKIEGFTFEESIVWRNFYSLFNIKAIYYFSIGKQHTTHRERILNNNDVDTGLTKDNTAR